MEIDSATYNNLNGAQLRDAQSTLNRILNDGIQKARIIMDLGSGSGNVTALMADTIPHDRVIGVDIDPAMVDFASKTCHDPSMEFHLQDISVPWEKLNPALKAFEGQVDLVFSNRVLHWVDDEDLPEVGRKVWRFLRPGSPFYINTRLIIDWNETLPEAERKENEKLLKIPSRQDQHEKWQQVFECAGFSGVSVEFGPRAWVYETDEKFNDMFRGVHFLYFRRYLSNVFTEEEKTGILTSKFQDLFVRANSTPLGQKIIDCPDGSRTSYYGQFDIKGIKPTTAVRRGA